jgi:hypothetical protein
MCSQTMPYSQYHSLKEYTRVFYFMKRLVAFLKTMFSKSWYSKYHCIFRVLETLQPKSFHGMSNFCLNIMVYNVASKQVMFGNLTFL